jgi:hypothetical protein
MRWRTVRGGGNMSCAHSHETRRTDDQHVHSTVSDVMKIYCLYECPCAVEVPEVVVRSVNYLIKGLCPKCSAHQH